MEEVDEFVDEPVVEPVVEPEGSSAVPEPLPAGVQLR